MKEKTTFINTINPSRPDSRRKEKISFKFLFSHFLVVPLKTCIKRFEAPQKSLKGKIQVKFHFNAT